MVRQGVQGILRVPGRILGLVYQIRGNEIEFQA